VRFWVPSVSLEGEIVVTARWDGARVTTVEVASTRPQVVNRLLSGRTAEEAVALVPRLFSICGRSQGVAAALACEAASAREPDANTRAARESAVRAEAVQESLWRMLVDWPQLAGAAPDPDALAAARRALAGASPEQALGEVRELVKARAIGTAGGWDALDDAASGERWLSGAAALPAVSMLAQLAAQRPAFGASDVPLLPADGDAVARAVGAALEADAAFEVAPTWNGAPAETGALARTCLQPVVAAVVARHGRSAFARFVARVVELVGLVRPDAPARSRVAGSVSLEPGAGIGWVETARGLLVHAVRLAAGRVERYRIVAPTEWNFHPRGALAAGLAGVTAANEEAVRGLAHTLVQSLDPCVAARVEVAHA
jgi:coenzyme F420-reducing hydrogenase alpha subunit